MAKKYTVQSGDSFAKIASKLGIDFGDLLAANASFGRRQGGFDLIHPGEVINIPSGPASPAARQSAFDDLAEFGALSRGQFSPTGIPGQVFAPQIEQPGITPEISGLEAQEQAFIAAGEPSVGKSLMSRKLGTPITATPDSDEEMARFLAIQAGAGRGGAGMTSEQRNRLLEAGFDPDTVDIIGRTGRVAGGITEAEQVAARNAPNVFSRENLAENPELRFVQNFAGVSGPFDDLTPEQRALARRFMDFGYSAEVAIARAKRNDQPLGGDVQDINPFRALENIGRTVDVWFNLNQTIPAELRTLQISLENRGMSEEAIEAQLTAREAELRTELFNEYAHLLQPEEGGGAPPGTAAFILERERELTGTQPSPGEGMQIRSVNGRAVPLFTNPDVEIMRQQNWDRAVGVAVVRVVADDIEPYENVLVYADALKVVVDLAQNNITEQTEAVLNQMTIPQMENLQRWMSTNQTLVNAYVMALGNMSREELIAFARTELQDLGYAQVPNSTTIYKEVSGGNAPDMAGAIEDMIFGGLEGTISGSGFGGGRFGPGSGSSLGRGRTSGSGAGPRAANFAGAGIGLYNWRIGA